jgi:hypothetical protein
MHHGVKMHKKKIRENQNQSPGVAVASLEKKRRRWIASWYRRKTEVEPCKVLVLPRRFGAEVREGTVQVFLEHDVREGVEDTSYRVDFGTDGELW